jgi:hypothetical protein
VKTPSRLHADGHAGGWRANLTDDEDQAVIYYPECAEWEFDTAQRTGRECGYGGQLHQGRLADPRALVANPLHRE